MYPWWTEEENCNLRYLTYHVSGVTVHVGNRPYKANFGAGSFAGVCCNKDFFDHVDTWISVTDTETLFPPKVQYFWFPWWEPEPPLEIAVKSFIATMDQIQERGNQVVYLHCDAGQHRSPTMLGFWLHWRGIKEIQPIHQEGTFTPPDIAKRNPIVRAQEHFAETPEILQWVTKRY